MPNQAKSKHFALQYLDSAPSLASKSTAAIQRRAELSTSPQKAQTKFVDDLNLVEHSAGQATFWLGLVVPKRHARRSVTRSLLKRQMREAVVRQQKVGSLKEGLWVLRLRAAFEICLFKSAASKTLAKAAGDELQELLALAVRCRGLEH